MDGSINYNSKPKRITTSAQIVIHNFSKAEIIYNTLKDSLQEKCNYLYSEETKNGNVWSVKGDFISGNVRTNTTYIKLEKMSGYYMITATCKLMYKDSD